MFSLTPTCLLFLPVISPPGFALQNPHSSYSLDWPKAFVFPERVFLRKGVGIRERSGSLTVPAPSFALNLGKKLKLNLFLSLSKSRRPYGMYFCVQTPIGALLDFLQQSVYFLSQFSSSISFLLWYCSYF